MISRRTLAIRALAVWVSLMVPSVVLSLPSAVSEAAQAGSRRKSDTVTIEAVAVRDGASVYATSQDATQDEPYKFIKIMEAARGDVVWAFCRFERPAAVGGGSWYAIEPYYYVQGQDFTSAGPVPACPTTPSQPKKQRFGTLNSTVFGQNAEHEKITRAALQCGSGVANEDYGCLRSETLGQFAGKSTAKWVPGGTFGAVGNPDNPVSGWSNHYPSHCDDMDYLSSYNNAALWKTRSLDMLRACVDHMWENLDTAIKDAAVLADAEGRVNDAEMTTPVIGLNCTYAGNFHGEAKCNVLQALGAAAHAYQDFYSHSNWADTSGGNSVDNPPALAQTHTPGFLDFSGKDHTVSAASVPAAFTGGCFDPQEKWFILWDSDNHCVNEGRITHKSLNKDDGTINPDTGQASDPKTPRGKRGTNFSKAVALAMQTTRSNWAAFITKVKSTYPGPQGKAIACAMAHDHPDNCRSFAQQ